MESPGLIWIPYGIGSANLRYLVSHETAHQWFYGLVGNDQARQPFADEAAADFMAREITGTRRGSRCSTAPLDRTIYGYSSTCYYEVVYIQGGNLINEARRRMGSTAFWAAMREYVADHRYRPDRHEHAAPRARRRDAGRPLEAVRAAVPEVLLSRRGGRPRAPAASAGTSGGRSGFHAASRRRASAATSRSRRPNRRPYASRTRGRQQADGRPQRPAVGARVERQPCQHPGERRVQDRVGELARRVGDLDPAAGREPFRDVGLERVEVARQHRLGHAEGPGDRQGLLVEARRARPRQRAEPARRTRRSSSRSAWRGPTGRAPGRARRSPARGCRDGAC